MLTIVLGLHDGGIDAGFAGASEPFVSVAASTIWEPNISADLEHIRWHDALARAIAALGVDAHRIQLVVSEPPLLKLQTKQKIADILLASIRVHSFAFMPQSVSCVVGFGLKGAIVISELPNCDLCVMPVFDCRELTPLAVLVAEREISSEQAIALAQSKADIHAQKALKRIINFSREAQFRGLSAASAMGGISPVLYRERWMSGHRRVYDSLFDWPKHPK